MTGGAAIGVPTGRRRRPSSSSGASATCAVLRRRSSALPRVRPSSIWPAGTALTSLSSRGLSASLREAHRPRLQRGDARRRKATGHRGRLGECGAAEGRRRPRRAGRGALDAVLCTLGLSAMPRHREAIASVRRALRPGARFAVLDAKPFDRLARPLNPMIKPLFRYTTNWDYERDLAADMREAFGNVGVREFNGGSLFLAVATRSADSASHRPERHDQPFEVHACSGDAARPLGTPFPRPEQRPQMRWT